MDSPWEEDPRADYAPEADWAKLSNEFTNSGYREGIIAGKESALQEGFDAGFAHVLRFSDIAPIDQEAEQHAREHLDASDDPVGQSEELSQKREMEGLEDMLQRLTAGAPSRPLQDRPTREDVIRLKEGILALSGQLGLDITP
ncbi:hypothetical protein EDD22DRAFT_978608 [Suillus occidentalis]|nr:hypothetical protein EDD22DRAFT_978608 [Suillus occidentalis]